MSGIRRIDPVVEAAIVREYAAGTSAGKLADRYAINRKTITTVVRRNGGVVLDQRVDGGRPPIDPRSYVSRVIELRDQGMSQIAIGRDIGICQTTVGKVLQSVGRPTQNRPRGERHGSWKGGRVMQSGYVAVRVPADWTHTDMIPRGGYVLEHRKVMAESLGRAMRPSETVHHLNGNKMDNRIENLQLRQGKHGKGVHMRCLACGSTNIEATET